MTASCIFFCCLLAGLDVPWELSGGRRGTDPGISALERELADSRKMALEKTRRSLGLVPGKLPIRWVLRLGRPADGTGAAKADAGWTEVGEDEVVVTIPAWRYLGFPTKVRRVVIHETVHAVMASKLGTPAAYRALPGWFREGTALLVSGEGPGRVKGRISSTLLEGGRSGGFLSGLVGAAPGSLGGRRVTGAEGYLAVRWIEERLGKSGLRELLAKLVSGGAFEETLGELIGLTPGRVAKAAFRYCSERIRGLISERSERLFAEAVALCSTGRHGPARKALRTLGALDGSVAVRDTAVFLQARTLVEDGLYEEAGGLLESLLRDGYEVPWEPEIFEQLGRCRAGVGKRREARSFWKMVADRFPHDGAVQARIAVLLEGGEPREP